MGGTNIGKRSLVWIVVAEMHYRGTDWQRFDEVLHSVTAACGSAVFMNIASSRAGISSTDSESKDSLSWQAG